MVRFHERTNITQVLFILIYVRMQRNQCLDSNRSVRRVLINRYFEIEYFLPRQITIKRIRPFIRLYSSPVLTFINHVPHIYRHVAGPAYRLRVFSTSLRTFERKMISTNYGYNRKTIESVKRVLTGPNNETKHTRLPCKRIVIIYFQRCISRTASYLSFRF